MRRALLWALVACIGLAFGGQALAQDGTVPDAKQQMKELNTQMRNLHKQLSQAQGKAGIFKDPEVVDLKKAMDEARKAFMQKLAEKSSANPETAELMKQLDETRQKYNDLRKAARPAGKPRPKKPRKDAPPA